MSVLVSFVGQDALPDGVLFSAYIGTDEAGYHQQIRAMTNGTTQVRHGDSTEWKEVA